MEERVCVFIDGSNLYHALRDTIGRTDINFGEFARKLAMGRPVFRVYYYNALQDPGRNAESARDQQEFLSLLNQTPYLEVRLGTLRVIGGVIVEKGVDVMLATDVVNYAYENMYDTAIIVSGDADYAYALQLVKNKGKHIEVAYFETNISRELQDLADNRHFLDRQYFEGLWTGHRISLRPTVAPARTRSRTRRTEIPAAEPPVAVEEVAVVEAVAPPDAAAAPDLSEAGAAGSTASRRRRRRGRGRGGSMSNGLVMADGAPSDDGEGGPAEREPAAELSRIGEPRDMTAAMPAATEGAGEPEPSVSTLARRRRRGRGGRGGRGGGGGGGGAGEPAAEGGASAAGPEFGRGDEPERAFTPPAADATAFGDGAGEAAPARTPRRRAPARRIRTSAAGASGPSNDGATQATGEAAAAPSPAPAPDMANGPGASGGAGQQPRPRVPRARRAPAATSEAPATPRRRTRTAAAPSASPPDAAS